MIKSFRGQLADQAKATIRLSTKDGLTGYKVKKFQLIGVTPGDETVEAVVKLHTVDPTTVNGTVNFDNPTLLGVAFYVSSTTEEWSTHNIIIFDHTIVNQDIFVTHFDTAVGTPINYYLELEQVKLDLNEATVATLKDMRGRE